MNEPVIRELPDMTVGCIEAHGPFRAMHAEFRRLKAWARQKKLKVAGKPFVIYPARPDAGNPPGGRYDACIQVPAGAVGEGDIVVKRLPACTVAGVSVPGAFEQLGAHYTELLAWLDIEGWTPAGAPREVYLKIPARKRGATPEDYLTEILFPVSR